MGEVEGTGHWGEQSGGWLEWHLDGTGGSESGDLESLYSAFK